MCAIVNRYELRFSRPFPLKDEVGHFTGISTENTIVSSTPPVRRRIPAGSYLSPEPTSEEYQLNADGRKVSWFVAVRPDISSFGGVLSNDANERLRRWTPSLFLKLRCGKVV